MQSYDTTKDTKIRASLKPATQTSKYVFRWVTFVDSSQTVGIILTPYRFAVPLVSVLIEYLRRIDAASTKVCYFIQHGRSHQSPMSLAGPIDIERRRPQVQPRCSSISWVHNSTATRCGSLLDFKVSESKKWVQH